MPEQWYMIPLAEPIWIQAASRSEARELARKNGFDVE